MVDERYLVRRADGQVILLTLALYLIISGLKENHSLDRVARDVSQQLGQPVTKDVVTQVINVKIKPLGILHDPSVVLVATASVEAERPLLSLTMRGTLVPPRVVRALTWLFHPLYWPFIISSALCSLLVADYYVLFVNGVSEELTQIQNQPILILPTFGILVASMVFHEIGHATACAYGGGKPGRIGFGVMLVFPALYTDVNDAYRLSRAARVRTDLGGVYFNAVSIVLLTLVFIDTGYAPIIPAVVFIHITMLQQMLPLVRLDGYYVLSDLVGVPDLFGRVKPVLVSLIPGRHDDRVDQLNPGARRIVAAWVVMVVPILLGTTLLFLWYMPTFVRNSYHSFQEQWIEANYSFEDHRWAALSLAVISLVLLSIPFLGLLAFTARLAKKVPLPTRRAT